MLDHARFGVAEIEGEDGKVWFQIGLVESDGDVETVPEEMAIVMLRDAAKMEAKFPGISDRKVKAAKIIAKALTEYAENHGLADGFFQEFH